MAAAEDFPRGAAECDGDVLTEILVDLPYGEIMDVGMTYYGEFFASLEYAADLLLYGAVFFGRPGTCRVIARFRNAIQLAWRPDDGQPPPYHDDTVTMRFEDVEMAERIGRFGVYSFGGLLYHARHLSDGTLELRKVRL